MAYDWIGSFFVPIIKTVFFIGIIGFVAYVILRALYNLWSQQWRYMIRYELLKRPLPQDTVDWCVDAMDNGYGYYEVKKLLLVNGVYGERFNETLWIYDKLLIKLKGGKEYGRKYERTSGKTKEAEGGLPTTKKS